jgi:hypothetical protein
MLRWARRHVEGRRPRFQTSREEREELTLRFRAAAQQGDLARLPDFEPRPTEVNGVPGVRVLDGQQRLISVWSLEIAGGEIRSISSVVNPDKLQRVVAIAAINAFNRVNAATRQITGVWVARIVEEATGVRA